MIRLSRLPLRWSIPLALLVGAALAGLYSLVRHGQIADREQETEALVRAADRLGRLQATLERLLRHGDREGAQQELSTMGADHDIEIVLLTDEQDRILNASRLALKGQPGQPFWGDEASTEALVQQVRDTMAGGVHLTQDRAAVLGWYPVLLGGTGHEVRPTRIGILFLRADLRTAKAIARRQVERQASETTAFLAVLAVLLWLFFHFSLTRPVARIIAAAERFAAGDRTARTHLRGQNELARVGRAFDTLADRVAADEARLLASEERYRALVETGPTVIVGLTPDHRIFEWNQAAERTYGLSRDEALGRDYVTTFLPAEVRDRVVEDIHQVLAGQPTEGFENEVLSPLVRRTLLWNVTRVQGGHGQVLGILATGQDITERKQTEEQLRTALREKETLLQEVHHRVKNNLAVVAGLLNLQADQIQDGAAAMVLRESQNRVHAMALIHESLYQRGDLARIDFADYTRNLATTFLSFHGAVGNVRLVLDLAPVFLCLDTAVPCGLILGELLSNCLKHAFAPGQTGVLRIELGQVDERYRLAVSDDGTGFPDGIDLERSQSLGIRIVRHLARQIGAQLDFHRRPAGALVELTFRETRST